MPQGLADLGRTLMAVGGLLLLVGLLLGFSDRIPWLGRLPGDFVYRRGRVTLYLPLGTSVLLSLILTLLLSLLGRK